MLSSRSFVVAAVTGALFALAEPLAAAKDDPVTTAERAESMSLRESLQAFRPILGSPALSAAVVTVEGIDVAAVGVRVLGAPGRVTAEDHFHTGSDVKAMFATVAARLVKSGQLRWDTTLQVALPELVANGGTAYRWVTLEDLLRHRSGLPALETQEALAAVPQFRGTPLAQRAQFAAWALRQRPIVRPRTQAKYSNAGYVVAAAMVERMTGVAFEQLMERELFRPLSMQVSYDWPATQSPARQPWGHESVGGQFVPRSPYWAPGRIPVWSRPAAGVSLSTRDFARFVRLHLLGLRGEGRLLDYASFVKLHTPVEGYGMGWRVVTLDGQTISTHIGASGLFAACMWIDAAAGRAAVAMVNADDDRIEIGIEQIAAALTAGMEGAQALGSAAANSR